MGKIRYAYDTASGGKAGVITSEGLPTGSDRSNQSQSIWQCLDDPRGGPEEGQLEPQEDRKFYVYYLRRPDKVDPFDPNENQPFYVGKGSNGRHLEHRREAEKLRHKPGRKYHKISIIHHLWKQGLDFQEEIIFDGLTEQEAFELEIEAIEAYGRKDLKLGCLSNLTNGGDGASGLIHSEEIRRQMSERMRIRMAPEEVRMELSRKNKGISKSEETKQKISKTKMGHIVTEETREKLRQANLGKKCLEETKQKLREANKGQTPSFGMKGKHHTPETKEKMRQKALLRRNNAID